MQMVFNTEINGKIYGVLRRNKKYTETFKLAKSPKKDKLTGELDNWRLDSFEWKMKEYIGDKERLLNGETLEY